MRIEALGQPAVDVRPFADALEGLDRQSVRAFRVSCGGHPVAGHHIGEPIETTGLAIDDRDRLMNLARGQIETMLRLETGAC